MKVGGYSLAWNTKCVIQGAAMVGMYYAGQKHLFDDGEEPGWNMKTSIFVTVVFLLVYWTNALLDNKYGCSHGAFFDSLKIS